VKQKPEESIRIYAAGLILKQLDILTAEFIQIRQPRDIEAVHRMRVSSRRMRANLEVFQDCLPTKRGAIWQAAIRDLTRALGDARDTDVQIDSINHIYKELQDPINRPGIRRLLLRLKQQRVRLQEKLINRLDAYETSGVSEEMNAAFTGLSARNLEVYLYTPELYKRSFDRIQSAHSAFLSYEEKIQDPANITDLHAMRIAGKNLRYVMECFAPIYSNQLKTPLTIMKTAQELLGNIHDCDVWILQLPDFLEREHKKTLSYFGRDRSSEKLRPGIEFLQGMKQKCREEMYTEFIAKWDQWKSEKVWDGLFHVLQVPFFNEQGMTPLSLIEQMRNGGNQ
jgi:CHAD domain-containing protein